MSRLRILLVAIAIVSTCVSQGLAQELKIATFEYSPFQYEENRKVKGIAADIVKEIFRRLKRPIRIDFYPFPRAVRNIQTGASDIIFTFYYKKDREKFALYSKEPLVNQTISLFVHKDSSIQFNGDLSALSQYKFGLLRYSYGKIFDDAVKNKVIPSVEQVSKMELNMKKFLSKRFDILPSDRWVAFYYYAQSNPKFRKGVQIKELQPPVQSFPAFIGFSKANKLEKLRDQVDATIIAMKQDGTYQKIINTYLDSWKVEGLMPVANQ